MIDHTFVVCAYGESAFLEDCVRSTLNQTIKGKTIICTATPNEHIKKIADTFQLKLYVNPDKPSISGDWNFGVSKVDTKYFTIAHQDDVYKDTYAEEMMNAFEQAKRPLIFFSQYAELRNDQEVVDTTLLKIKRIMLLPLKIKIFQRFIWIRRRILSMGNPICCPAVSYCKENLELPIFSNRFQCDLDWYAWENISKLNGEFLYSDKILMCHRIHEDSTTTELIGNSIRYKEDKEMFNMFWPSCIANFIHKFYSKSENSNEII